MFAIRGKQVDGLGAPQGGGVEVPTDGGPVQKQDDYLFVSRSWCSAFHPLKALFGTECCYVLRSYVILTRFFVNLLVLKGLAPVLYAVMDAGGAAGRQAFEMPANRDSRKLSAS